MGIERVEESGVYQDSDETYEAQHDMYRQPRPDSAHSLDEPDPRTPLDNCVKLGGDKYERA